MKTKLLNLLAIIFTTVSIAQTFTEDGFNYNVLSTNPNEVEVTGGNNNASPIIIPSTATDGNGITYTVTTIGNSAYRNRANNGVILPNSITTIKFRAFRDNNGLTSITLPASVTTIEGEAFFQGGLNEVIALGTTPPNISSSSFDNRTNIDLTVPTSLEVSYLANGWTGFGTINGVNPNTFPLTAVIGGITYRISSVSPREVRAEANTNSGVVVIPSSVTINGDVYSVVAIGSNSFRGDGITAITMPNTIRTIGTNAFGFNSISTLNIPNSVTSIQGGAFQVNQLTTLVLPNSVTSVSGGRAFAQNQISSVTLSENITIIPTQMLAGNQITSITLPGGIQTIGERAFESNLINEVTIPEGVTIIGDEAFRDNQITNVSLPSTLTSIGEEAFEINQIDELVLPSTLTAIGSEAFNANPLTSVTASYSPPITIPNNTFGNRQNIALTVPSGLELDYENAGWIGFATINGVTQLNTGDSFDFGGLTYLVLSLDDEEVQVTGGSSIPTNLVLTETVSPNNRTFTITRVGSNAFDGAGLTSVSLPNTITIIGTDAFRNNQLSSIVLSDNVISIGNRSFENNVLTTITLSNNLTNIPNNSFRNNNLTTIELPANINSLQSSAFRGNPLTSVTSLNTTPPGIEGTTFSNRGGIVLTVPVGNELDYLTNGWTGFASINGEDAAVFNEFEVDGITYRIADQNPNIAQPIDNVNTGDIIVPGVISDGNNEYSINFVGFRAFLGNTITSVKLNNAITILDRESFRGNQITNIVFSDNLTSIRREAFESNDLTSIELPGKLSSIDSEAFNGNPLTSVTSLAETPPNVNANSFGNNRADIDLIVPTGTTDDYLANGWTDFKSITEVGVKCVVAPKVYLQGAALNPNTGEETLMRDDLRVAGLIPTASPYKDGTTCDSAVFTTTGNNAIVDWIFVELRDASDNTVVKRSASALLQRDGDIVTTDGTSPLLFITIEGDYFITIKHRNHLGVMTNTGITLSETSTALNFSDASNQISFGNNAQTDSGMPANVLGMWAGDSNGDGQVKFAGANSETTGLKDAVLDSSSNFFNSLLFTPDGYFTEDINMDGEIIFSGANNELLSIKDNVLFNPGNIFNSLLRAITAQLP